MTSTQQYLVEGCRSRIPEIRFGTSLRARNVAGRWTEPILVHAQASEILRQDLVIFVERRPYSQNGMRSTLLYLSESSADLDLTPRPSYTVPP